MFLNKIRATKEKELSVLKAPKIDVFEIFKNKPFNIIAEIKKASPSRGDINTGIDVLEIAKGYVENGATMISVLTESEYFKGDKTYLKDIRLKCPNALLLRKDFIMDDFQLYEAKFLGADIVLLILAFTGTEKTKELIKTAKSIGLEVLLEVHNEEEMQEALELNTNFIGVNNRNLKTLEVSLDNARGLAKYITKDKIFVCESGLTTAKEIKEMAALGYRACLIGSYLMEHKDPAKALKDLIFEVKDD